MEDLFRFGFKMTGIHYSLHASMIAMLDTGRHVRMEKNNVYVTKHYDENGLQVFFLHAAVRAVRR